jgi:hypothetical protein
MSKGECTKARTKRLQVCSDLVEQAMESDWPSAELGRLVGLIAETENLKPKDVAYFLGETCASVMTSEFIDTLGIEALGGEDHAPGRIVGLLRESTRGRHLLVERLAGFVDGEYLLMNSPAVVQSMIDLIESNWDFDDIALFATRLCSCCRTVGDYTQFLRALTDDWLMPKRLQLLGRVVDIELLLDLNVDGDSDNEDKDSDEDDESEDGGEDLLEEEFRNQQRSQGPAVQVQVVLNEFPELRQLAQWERYIASDGAVDVDSDVDEHGNLEGFVVSDESDLEMEEDHSDEEEEWTSNKKARGKKTKKVKQKKTAKQAKLDNEKKGRKRKRVIEDSDEEEEAIKEEAIEAASPGGGKGNKKGGQKNGKEKTKKKGNKTMCAETKKGAEGKRKKRKMRSKRQEEVEQEGVVEDKEQSDPDSGSKKKKKKKEEGAKQKKTKKILKKKKTKKKTKKKKEEEEEEEEGQGGAKQKEEKTKKAKTKKANNKKEGG